MKTPKVSVIIPVYNAEKHLRQCLESVINQTLEDIEIICIDDGSTDRSAKILQSYAEEDSRVIFFRQKNQGAGTARNRGITEAKGKYIAFMDADDYYPDVTVVCALYEAAEEHDALISGGSLIFFKNRKLIPGNWDGENYCFDTDGWMEYRELQQDYHYQRFLFSRRMLMENQIFFPDYRRYQDPPFFVRAVVTAGRFYAISQNVYVYRAGASTVNWTDIKVRDMLRGATDVLRLSGEHRLAHLHYLTAKRVTDSEFLHGIIRRALESSDMELWKTFQDFRDALDTELIHEEPLLNHKYLTAMCMPEYVHALQTFSLSTRLSVVVAAYNVEQYLPKCMESIVSQTQQDIEIICVDDGSTDGTRKILEDYAARDRRIRLVLKDVNEGLLLARKDGVAAASGAYIMFVDSDDYFVPEACEHALKLIEDKQVDVLQFTIGVKDYSGDEAAKRWLEQALTPVEEHISGNRILDEFYITRRYTTSMLGKIYRTSVLRAAYACIPDIHCYVGEDIFQQFYFAFFTDNYEGVRTKPLYWYRRGLGVSGAGNVTLEKYQLYCAMSNLSKQVGIFLRENGCIEYYRKPYDALTGRMMQDCCRMYARRLTEEDKLQGGELLLRHWSSAAGAEEIFPRELGVSLEQFSAEHVKIPNYTHESIAYGESGKTPMVSVVIPVYNTAAYLRECLDSAAGQTLRDIEIIVVNDGSNDASLFIIEEYAKADERFTVISQNNTGQSTARNVGLSVAHGKYVLFLDSDDVLRPTAAEELAEYAIENQLDVLFFDADAFYESEELRKQFEHYSVYYHSSQVFRRVLSGQELFAALQHCGDYRMSVCLQFIRREYLTEKQISFLDGILHEDNLFTFLTLMQADRAAKVNQRYYLRRVREGSTVTSRKSFRHLYGFLKCYAGMMTFVDSAGLTGATAESARAVIMEVRDNVGGVYNRLDAEQKNLISELSMVEQLWFEAAMGKIILTPEKSTLPDSVIDEAELIRASWSYRIGRFITFIPRKIRGGIRCYQEHGMKYTLWRVKVKLRALAGR